MAKYDRRPGNRDKLRPIRYDRTCRPSNFPSNREIYPFYTLLSVSLPPPSAGRVRREFTDCDCVWRNPYFGVKVLSLSLREVQLYTSEGEEIGDTATGLCIKSILFCEDNTGG